MRVRLTKTILDREHAIVAASRGGRKIIWDDGGVAGFGARLTGKHVSFILNYRATNRTERRMTIGTLGELTVESARKRAAEVKLEVRAGGDPLMALRDQRRAVMQQRITLKAAVAKWHAANIKHWRPVTASKYLGIVEKDVLPRLGDKELEKITRVEWADLLTDVGQRSRSLAALLRSVIGSFIHWCVDHELLTAANLPSAKRVAPKQGTRERVVSDGEIARIWAATEALRSRERAFARFIVLSVVRSGAASLTMLAWVSDGAIIYPGDTPGLKRTIDRSHDHLVALNEWAWKQIAVERSKPGDSLFGGNRISSNKAKEILNMLRKESGVDGWVWHDFRRSFRSWAAKNGVQPNAAETVLGHKIHRSAVDEAYMKYGFEREAENALFGWQRHVRQIVEGEGAVSNGMPLARG